MEISTFDINHEFLNHKIKLKMSTIPLGKNEKKIYPTINRQRKINTELLERKNPQSVFLLLSLVKFGKIKFS